MLRKSQRIRATHYMEDFYVSLDETCDELNPYTGLFTENGEFGELDPKEFEQLRDLYIALQSTKTKVNYFLKTLRREKEQ